ncbi:Uncharacterised protein [uncultured archaeon]|nr:Uncharacterised protein [uncultured archaeon]
MFDNLIVNTLHHSYIDKEIRQEKESEYFDFIHTSS